MSNLIEHAKHEFHLAGWTDEDGKVKDELQESIYKCVTELLEVFSNQVHSYTSRNCTLNLFSKLAKGESIQLTDEQKEMASVCSVGALMGSFFGNLAAKSYTKND